MAKPFYTLEEVCDVLKKSQDEVKDLVRVGKLREFRDAGKIFFKSDDVMRLAPAGATLPADEELPSLSDRGSGGTSVIGLVPDDESDMSATPRTPPPAQKKKEDSSIPMGGISVLDDELEIDADPMAKTHITSGAMGEQSTGESGRSGSGLMDLTRESDDTSLGAELLDEIYPGEEEAAAAPPPPKRKAAPAPVARTEVEEIESVSAASPVIMPPSYVPAGDPSEGLFAGLLVGALILFAIAGSVVGGVLQGFFPDYARAMTSNFLYLMLGAVLIPLISLLIGWLIGRSSAAPRRA